MLVLGATSDMARAIAGRFCADGWDMLLAGRDRERVEREASDLGTRYQKEIPALVFDACRPESHADFWETLPVVPDAVLCAVGILGDQEQARHDGQLAQEILQSNFTGLVSILGLAADSFERRGQGIIIGISSVAGDRGRGSNYVYGSAKAGFSAFLSGLRNRLSGTGVYVLTVKPGFVATRMTGGMRLPPLITASPGQVADAVARAVARKRDVIYVKGCWRIIMAIVRLIPEGIFKKLRL